MNTLTTLYDGGTYAERRRTKDLKLEIPRPQLNILGATTPSYLNSLLPQGAWDQGFISRTILIYSGERAIRDVFAEELVDPALHGALTNDLKLISEQFGKMDFTPECVEAIREWNSSDCAPQPTAPKLKYYCTRRLLHTLKLTMVASIDRDPSLVIERQDFERARSWLLSAEAAMDDIFLAMNTGGDGTIMEDTWNFVYKIQSKEKRPISEQRIVSYLSTKTPTHNIKSMLDTLIRAGMLELVPGGYQARPKL